jgi:hypothetical protein
VSPDFSKPTGNRQISQRERAVPSEDPSSALEKPESNNLEHVFWDNSCAAQQASVEPLVPQNNNHIVTPSHTVKVIQSWSPFGWWTIVIGRRRMGILQLPRAELDDVLQ